MGKQHQKWVPWSLKAANIYFSYVLFIWMPLPYTVKFQIIMSFVAFLLHRKYFQCHVGTELLEHIVYDNVKFLTPFCPWY